MMISVTFKFLDHRSLSIYNSLVLCIIYVRGLLLSISTQIIPFLSLARKKKLFDRGIIFIR